MLVTDDEIQRYIVETHSTVATLVERSIGIDRKLVGVIERQDKTNGSVADIQSEQYKQEGALAALKWALTTLIAITGIGVGVAGIILAIVARGG